MRLIGPPGSSHDDEHGLHQNDDHWLEKLAPHELVSGYRHNVGEDNAGAHMKRQIMGRQALDTRSKINSQFCVTPDNGTS